MHPVTAGIALGIVLAAEEAKFGVYTAAAETLAEAASTAFNAAVCVLAVVVAENEACLETSLDPPTAVLAYW
jgi:hypothetical protein